MRITMCWLALFLGICCTGLHPCGATEIAGKTTKAPEANITEIVLDRQPCLGVCPWDKIILRADGNAVYIGKLKPENIEDKRSFPGFDFEMSGRYTGQVSRSRFDRLASLINNQGFFALNWKYWRPATDQSAIIITVVRGSERKMVTADYDWAPPAFFTIKQAVVDAASEIAWKQAGRDEQDNRTGLLRGVALASYGTGRDLLPHWTRLPKAVVTVQDKDGREVARTLTDESGQFEIVLLPSSYKIMSLMPPPGSIWWADQRLHPDSAHTYLYNGETTDVMLIYTHENP